VKRTLFFDVDETLMVEEPAAVAAFEATAQFAASRCEIDPTFLATGARLRARELWYAAPDARVLPAGGHQLVGGLVVPF
jgi:hypothetical protein